MISPSDPLEALRHVGPPAVDGRATLVAAALGILLLWRVWRSSRQRHRR